MCRFLEDCYNTHVTSSASQLLDRLLEPIGQALTPEAARRLVDLRADDETQRLMDSLAEAANEGRLDESQREEYESLVAVSGLIAILQAKARRVLGGTTAA